MPDDSKYTSLLAMVVVVAVPLIGVWEVFRQDELPASAHFASSWSSPLDSFSRFWPFYVSNSPKPT